MKRVFSRAEEVAGVWAARVQRDGRTGNGNFFFEDDVVYSYRWSFPVAALFDAPDGRTFCLVVKDTPSTSTAAVRSVAAAAARDAGHHLVELSTIRDLVDAFSRPRRKAGIKAAEAIRGRIQEDIEALKAVCDRAEDNSFAQSARLSTIAALLRTHREIAEAFGRRWPAPASAESFEARAEMAYEVSRAAGRARTRADQKAAREAERRDAFERANPLPAAEELAAWRTGERLALRNQPAVPPHAIRSLHARIFEGRFSVEGGWTRPLRDFSALLTAAAKAAGGHRDAPGSVSLGGTRVEIGAEGDVVIGRDRMILFRELMTCARLGAPRLHAKAAALVGDALDDDEEFEAGPRGLAP